jgi:hypothetical protein
MIHRTPTRPSAGSKVRGLSIHGGCAVAHGRSRLERRTLAAFSRRLTMVALMSRSICCVPWRCLDPTRRRVRRSRRHTCRLGSWDVRSHRGPDGLCRGPQYWQVACLSKGVKRHPGFPGQCPGRRRGRAYACSSGWRRVWSQSKTGCASRSRDHCHRDADHINPEVPDQGDWHRLTAVLFAHVDVRRKSPCRLKSAALAERLKMHRYRRSILSGSESHAEKPSNGSGKPSTFWVSSPGG